MLKNAAKLFGLTVVLIVLVSQLFYSDNQPPPSGLDCAYSPNENGFWGYGISDNEVYGVCEIDEALNPLPDKLIISPGVYEWKFTTQIDGPGISIDASEPGTYRLLGPESNTRQFMVWSPEYDVEKFMIDFGNLYVHGNRDDQSNLDDLVQSAKTRILSVTCGTISRLIQKVLASFKIESRIVQTLTTEERNGLDDGHLMLEVKSGKSWTIFDPDNRSVFQNQNGQGMSVADLDSNYVPLVGKNIKLYGPLMMTDVGGFLDGEGKDMGFLGQRSRLSSTSLSRWYKRVMGIVGVEIDGALAVNQNFAVTHQETLDEMYPNHYLVDVEFLKK